MWSIYIYMVYRYYVFRNTYICQSQCVISEMLIDINCNEIDAI